ncbi:PEP-CTERM sorting domain-containing protein [Massilia oculi]|uniref:PEP-CTERM sorting domain-containing protein n=1 Tax=Massilia hydrophila TaxID=3044279 RepID=A0ABS7Y684_9BURK|nr:PEP-CTERM sorting domain-containing protein [Massilia oculi]MCA1854481.1 PEP-CTERM sorting domain-containing protein [Massilia oculi]
MNKTLFKLLGASLFAVATTMAGTASAKTMLGQAPDPSLIVKAGGFEWVYAGPCAGTGNTCGAVVLHHDFAFASEEQWNASFTSLEALRTAFTSNGQTLCASTYFNTVYDHCDLGDMTAGYVWHSPLAPSESHRNDAASETFLVRVTQTPPPGDVPEPASLALLGLGMAGIAAARRKQSR